MNKLERFRMAVIKYLKSDKSAQDLYEYSVQLWAATKLGDGLGFSQVSEEIEAMYKLQKAKSFEFSE